MTALSPQPERLYGERVIAADETLAGIGARLTGLVLDPPVNRRWWIAFALACGLASVYAAALAYLLVAGVGIWDNNTPVVWAMDIASYDWWIGIASGSLLVSAVLLLVGAEWRCAVNRIAETVALLGTIAAGLYPIIHLGRPWFFYWNLPYLNTFDLYPQFRSPLVWDATNIVSYLVVCVSFWYIGLLPDLATLRDRAFEAAQKRAGEGGLGPALALLRARGYGLLAAGWRSSAIHWQRWVEAYRTIALLGCLLVVSLQTGASVMFAGSVLPGWHDTLLPVTFLVGAVLSGVGLTAALVVAIRAIYRLDALVTERHLDILARMILVLGLASLYCHAAEVFSTLLHGDAFDRATLMRRLGGNHAWAFWTLVVCGLLPVQVFWLARARRSGLAIALVGVLVAVGTYADHMMVLVVTLQHDFLPSSAQAYAVGFWGLATFAGSVGLFLVLLLLFVRYLPVVSIVETRQLALSHNPGQAQAEARSGETPANPAEAEHGRTDAPLWGIAAEFASPAALAAAARALADERETPVRFDAHGPVPMPEVVEALRLPDRPVRGYALAGAALGGFGFLALCLWCTLWLYPLDIGGRPQVSWPSFVVPSVSVAMMTGTLAIHLALLVLNRLPRLNHPAFNIPGFLRSSRDRFFLAAELREGHEDEAERIERRLAALPEDGGRPLAIRRVPR